MEVIVRDFLRLVDGNKKHVYNTISDPWHHPLSSSRSDKDLVEKSLANLLSDPKALAL
jgi:hypothetical protein